MFETFAPYVPKKGFPRAELNDNRHECPPAVLIGDTPSLTAVKQTIARVAPTQATVLLRGETGTGKEVAARLLHQQSMRHAQCFMILNCGSLTRDAFTDPEGIVGAAAGGTLFLDEICDLPIETQAKFLQLLSSQETRRSIESRDCPTDIRIIAATNSNISEAIATGRLRHDLYFRLATVAIEMPALRHILDDLPHIAQYLLDHLHVAGSLCRRLSASALEAAKQYHWPGNVRELRNAIERGKIFCNGPEIEAQDLALSSDAASGETLPMVEVTGMHRPPHLVLSEIEQETIQRALRLHGGNKTAAARALGVSLRTLYNKLDAKMLKAV